MERKVPDPESTSGLPGHRAMDRRPRAPAGSTSFFRRLDERRAQQFSDGPKRRAIRRSTRRSDKAPALTPPAPAGPSPTRVAVRRRFRVMHRKRRPDIAVLADNQRSTGTPHRTAPVVRPGRDGDGLIRHHMSPPEGGLDSRRQQGSDPDHGRREAARLMDQGRTAHGETVWAGTTG